MKSLKPLTKSWSVLKWVGNNKLVLNISKTKNIVFGTNHSLSARPQLNLVMNSVAEDIEELRRLNDLALPYIVNCHGQNIDSMAANMGRGLAIIKRCSAFDNTLKKVSSAGYSFV
jgi:hypothetical protein